MLLGSLYLSSLFPLSLVLKAAVTQASLQSLLHKILTAGPSAFNITTLLSQAAQLSNQGRPSAALLFYLASLFVFRYTMATFIFQLGTVDF